LEDLGVNERAILKWILKTEDGRNVDWTNLAPAGIIYRLPSTVYLTPGMFLQLIHQHVHLMKHDS
jgi:hypothetical protein